ILLPHSTERDAIMVAEALGLQQLRTLMAVTQIHGIRTPLAAWSGIIAVHHDQSPGAAVKASIRIMQSEKDSDFLAFPQGALSKKVCQTCGKVQEAKRVCPKCHKEVDKKDVLCPDDGSIVEYVTPDVCPDDGGYLLRVNMLKRAEFFDGTMMIGKMTAAKSEKPVAVLPGAIAYDREPSHRTWLHRFFHFIGWKNFRNFFGDNTVYGAGIAFGKPIPFSELPGKYDKMMDVVFRHIVELSDELHTEMGLPLPIADRVTDSAEPKKD
ncbi:MAG: hypothetical protein K2Q23_02695, partial [Bryobacteraceae bacterium]|nr:hypothetical protein [Bryobacteraceae bacterium]